MENFVIKINRVYMDVDTNKSMILFDVFLNDQKVGESTAEYSVFQGIMMSKYNESVSERFYANLLKMQQQ